MSVRTDVRRFATATFVEDGMIEALAFVLLTFAVVVVALAQLHLYRRVRENEPLTAGWSSPQWPLKSVSAGDSLPDAIAALMHNVAAWAGLLLVCADNHDEYGVVASVSSVAAEWDLQLLLARRESGSPSGWESRLPPEVRELSFEISAEAFDALGCSGTPVLLAVDRGRVLDASHDLTSPSGIAERMRYVAPQLKPSKALTPSYLENELGSTP